MTKSNSKPEFNFFSAPPVVLSQGRAASVQIARWLTPYFSPNKILKTKHGIYHLKSGAEFPNGYSGVIHSHELISPHILTNRYTRIFTIRQNPVETIVSRIIAQHYDRFHLTLDNVNDILEPFTFDQFDSIDQFCESYVSWHNFYSQQLDRRSFVIVFETFIRNLAGQAYEPIYPNKEQQLINVFQVREYIAENHLLKMLRASDPFLTHTNPTNIYDRIYYDTINE